MVERYFGMVWKRGKEPLSLANFKRLKTYLLRRYEWEQRNVVLTPPIYRGFQPRQPVLVWGEKRV